MPCIKGCGFTNPFLNIEARQELFRLIIEVIKIPQILIYGAYNNFGILV